jgi:D-alanyl-lipoteichoic acid acyltransferase DltB (MBOAT superfamily)
MLDYLSGIQIFNAETQRKKRMWLLISLIINLGFLGYFKYYNFFVESFADLLQSFGFKANITTLKIIIPVGISFYTFHGVSYVLDIYHGKIQPTRNIIDYALFVSFFPLLVAGPIERATHLLPQLKKPRSFDYSKAVDGMRQILWGLFKKVVIADNCASYVNKVFENYPMQTGSTLALAAVFFAFQLYCDFSGYSDIALGSARLLGIELLRNFNYPYFATSFADYWKRNHISMTTWFMDYVYYPMIGKSDKLWFWNLCMILTFLLSGLWHGAGWNFILWGFYQGVFIVISMNLAKPRKRFEKRHNMKNNRFWTFGTMFLTFGIVCFGLVLFRAETIGDAVKYLSGIFDKSLLSLPWGCSAQFRYSVFICLPLLLIVEWLQRNKQHGLQMNVQSLVLRWFIYISLIFIIWAFGGEQETFIYFQF